ncbi:MAG: hypothetical protein D3906_04980 [Candidatus Electrothrix sp. AUS1_2]|nr:hypothetical protein [Candidatus Electrothrix sp. AUS1_2]
MIEIIKANKRLAITTLVLWLLSRLELLWLKTAQAPPSPADGKPSSSPFLGFSPEYRLGSNQHVGYGGKNTGGVGWGDLREALKGYILYFLIYFHLLFSFSVVKILLQSLRSFRAGGCLALACESPTMENMQTCRPDTVS